MSTSAKSRKLSVFDRLGPEEDTSHASRRSSYTGHKREHQHKPKHNRRQSYDGDDYPEKLNQQSYSSRRGSSKERHSSRSSDHYQKASVEGESTDGSANEDTKKEQSSKRLHGGDKEARDDVCVEKNTKTFRAVKQTEESSSVLVEGAVDVGDEQQKNTNTDSQQEMEEEEETALVATVNRDDVSQPVEQVVIGDSEAGDGGQLRTDVDLSIPDAPEAVDRQKDTKNGKEKRRKQHKTEKPREIDETCDKPSDTDEQDYSRNRKRRAAVTMERSNAERDRKQRPPPEEPLPYRDRRSRGTPSELDRSSSRGGGDSSWKPPANDRPPEDRHRDDRPGSSAKRSKTSSAHHSEEVHARRDRTKDRQPDVSLESSSRKRKRSPAPDDCDNKRQKRKRQDIYDSFSEEEMANNSSDKQDRVKQDADVDLSFLQEQWREQSNSTATVLDRFRPARMFMGTGISVVLSGSQLYQSVSDMLLEHLVDEGAQVDTVKSLLQKSAFGAQVATRLSNYRAKKKLIKDVGPRSKAITAQADLLMRNKLRKATSNHGRCFQTPNAELLPTWDTDLCVTGVELYKMNNSTKKSKFVTSHCGSVVYA